MGWIKQAPPPPNHACVIPWRDGAEVGDLWRCNDCRKLWRYAEACDICDAYGPQPHKGMHTVGYVWRSATAWQRLRYWRAS